MTATTMNLPMRISSMHTRPSFPSPRKATAFSCTTLVSYIFNLLNFGAQRLRSSCSLNWNLLYAAGHGTKIRDDDSGEEGDGYDEALCPRDFQSAGMIRDDDLFDILVKPLADGVHMVSLMDCCHSGMYWELPRLFVVIPCFNLWCWLVIPPW